MCIGVYISYHYIFILVECVLLLSRSLLNDMTIHIYIHIKFILLHCHTITLNVFNDVCKYMCKCVPTCVCIGTHTIVGQEFPFEKMTSSRKLQCCRQTLP